MLMMICGGAALAEPALPVRIWGEVLGLMPARVDAVLTDSAGGAVASAQAQLAPSGGRMYYAAQWPSDAIKTALDAGKRLSLTLLADGERRAPALELGRAVPDQIDLIAGRPTLPRTRFVLARAHLTDSGAVVLTAAIEQTDDGEGPGLLRWTPARPGATPVSVSLELQPGGVTTSKLTHRPEDASDVAPVWTVTWESRNRSRPRVMERVRATSFGRTAVENFAETGPIVQSAAGALPLFRGDLAVAPGQYLEMHLEYIGNWSSSATSMLTSWTAQNLAAGTQDSGWRLDEARVVPLAGGGAWVAASWLAPARRQLSGLGLRAPGIAALPGPWRVRYLGHHNLLSPGGNF